MKCVWSHVLWDGLQGGYGSSFGQIKFVHQCRIRLLHMTAQNRRILFFFPCGQKGRSLLGSPSPPSPSNTCLVFLSHALHLFSFSCVSCLIYQFRKPSVVVCVTLQMVESVTVVRVLAISREAYNSLAGHFLHDARLVLKNLNQATEKVGASSVSPREFCISTISRVSDVCK